MSIITTSILCPLCLGKWLRERKGERKNLEYVGQAGLDLVTFPPWLSQSLISKAMTIITKIQCDE